MNLLKVCGQCIWFKPLEYNAKPTHFGVCAQELGDTADVGSCDTCHHISEECAHGDKFKRV